MKTKGTLGNNHHGNAIALERFTPVEPVLR